MNPESIKILRSKISIPLNKAIELLKMNNGDVALSEQSFHTENIIEICKVTECDEETAQKEYQICNCDVTKAVERINQKLVVIGTGKFQDSKIGFILWPENENGEFYKTAKRNDAFITAEDFDLVLEVFQSVFPLQNPWNNSSEDKFDKVGNNFFDKKKALIILQKINEIKSKDANETRFLKELTEWLNDKLSYAAYIVVYGNL
ncbi:hypothetical protein [Flavobacterium hungaricum]|uniref:Uncharacterized protein n=1 Tax=Flavobacterium hungaricum TaxID=2082725 RepID=A0ABR9TRQ1_9FLAO|nr:hypothetical protein [Flavobacterium hungaricum]MBE8727312.1 hypothetical protein [Flavobacterium hungaricum]